MEIDIHLTPKNHLKPHPERESVQFNASGDPALSAKPYFMNRKTTIRKNTIKFIADQMKACKHTQYKIIQIISLQNNFK